MTFKAAPIFQAIKSSVDAATPAEKADKLKKINAVFQFNVKNGAGEQKTWTLDLKSTGAVTEGAASGKPDITITVADNVFADIASGKIAAQKAFMAGKLKVSGNMMQAMKLDGLFKDVRPALNAAAAAPKPAAAAPAAAAAPTAGALTVDGVASSQIFNQIHAGLQAMSPTERAETVKKAKAVFQFNIKAGGAQHTFTLDLKNGSGDVYQGACKTGKADATITIADQDFVSLASGKANGQKLFMAGKLKIAGQMMLATKLDGILKGMQKKPKL